MEQNKHKIIITACPSCGNTHFQPFLSTKDYFLTQEDFNLDQCKECGLIFTNPIPSQETISSYYESENYLSHNATKNSLIDTVYRIARQINIRRKYKLIKKYIRPLKVLEIGTGTGELLYFFKKKNCETIGIEPNLDARNYSKTKYGLHVFAEDKLENLEKNSFDLVMMWHVFEHVSDLNSRLIQVKSLLKHDGVIIIAVPNIESPDSRYYQKYWAGLDVPRHLYHFSKASMEQLFKAQSISLIQTHPLKLDAYYVSLLSEKYKGNKIPYIKAFYRGILSNLSASRNNNNYSSIIFVAKKN